MQRLVGAKQKHRGTEDTTVLNQTVKRNADRFPEDFMFQLSAAEFENWKSQIVTSNPAAKMGGRRRPYAFTKVIQHLDWPCKTRDGRFVFLCPRCQETESAVNPRTNLGRCFRCETNFNPIDFTICAWRCDFRTAVEHLTALLPR